MRDAVIVSTARTAIGKAYRGGFNATSGPTLGSYSLAAAVERAGIEGGEIDDVLWGSALQQGTHSVANRPAAVSAHSCIAATPHQPHRNPHLQFCNPWFDQTEHAQERMAKQVRTHPV